MINEDQSDKPFEPTPQKLLEARRKGEIARSSEILAAASYSGLFVGLALLGPSSVEALGSAFKVLIDQADEISDSILPFGGTAVAFGTMKTIAYGLLPVFLSPIVAVLAVLFATRSIVFAPVKIQPKASKVSVISNAKNKFGRNGLFQFFVSFLKLNIYSACLAYFLHDRLNDMIAASASEPRFVTSMLAEVCMAFLFVVVVVSAIIGIFDMVWQHFEHIRKNRMSRKEVKDETKNAEGDPQVKQQMRSRAQASANKNISADVAKADVVIVNPTHFAVALRWERTPGSAPVCVAKGLDEVAHHVRELAHEHGIPIHEDPPTARALFATTKLGEEIAPEHYKAVAAAIRFSEHMRQKAKRAFA
ncbi:MAG: flagellar type III secretion system protein FlhB [Pseudomonadota bacterium]